MTADQLAESGSGTEGSDELRGTKSADIILDMRGPQTRVLSSLRDLPRTTPKATTSGAEHRRPVSLGKSSCTI